MKIENRNEINASADKIWQVLALEFDQVDRWFSQVPKAHRLNVGDIANGSPMVGRVCELSTNEDGPLADERIVYFNQDEMEFHVRVTPQNAKLPIDHNMAKFKVNDLGNKAEVVLSSNITLKSAGKLLYPVLKFGVKKSFDELLEELKYFIEKGEAHPRKKAKDLKRAA